MAGRKAGSENDAGLVPELKRLVAPAPLGGPMRPLIWCRSFGLAVLPWPRRSKAAGLVVASCWQQVAAALPYPPRLVASSDCAAAWYEGYGAVRLADAPQTLLLPLKTIAAAIQAGLAPVSWTGEILGSRHLM